MKVLVQGRAGSFQRREEDRKRGGRSESAGGEMEGRGMRRESGRRGRGRGRERENHNHSYQKCGTTAV